MTSALSRYPAPYRRQPAGIASAGPRAVKGEGEGEKGGIGERRARTGARSDPGCARGAREARREGRGSRGMPRGGGRRRVVVARRSRRAATSVWVASTSADRREKPIVVALARVLPRSVNVTPLLTAGNAHLRRGEGRASEDGGAHGGEALLRDALHLSLVRSERRRGRRGRGVARDPATTRRAGRESRRRDAFAAAVISRDRGVVARPAALPPQRELVVKQRVSRRLAPARPLRLPLRLPSSGVITDGGRCIARSISSSSFPFSSIAPRRAALAPAAARRRAPAAPFLLRAAARDAAAARRLRLRLRAAPARRRRARSRAPPGSRPPPTPAPASPRCRRRWSCRRARRCTRAPTSACRRCRDV